ncbi:hypothetical protein [Phaeacidiphilus oryzae]|uniref:hypothetical protein n=1 Tax=Phaeacidiphilus oryzae TaxID=348818 RepID=UPI0007C66CE6|nr:hypothetical protein [Phaeacidiphilus oryzae]
MSSGTASAGAPAAAGGAMEWTGSARNWWQLVLGAVAGVCVAIGVLVVLDVQDAASGTAMAMTAAGSLAAGLLLGAGALAFLWVRVGVDGEGVTVRCGAGGLPRARFRLADVADASRAEVSPLTWGGWGYRFRGAGRERAYVIRGGPALVLRLGDGRRVTVTVDDPDGAVAAIAAARAATTAGGRES